MTFMSFQEILIGFLFLLPIITLIHEGGHAFFAKLFGAEIKKIVVGKGKTVLKLSKLEIKKIYFWPGYFTADKLGHNKLTKIITLLGGILFNLASCLIIITLLELKIVKNNNLFSIFVSFSIFQALACFLPIRYLNKTNSDGLQIYQIIKTGTSNFNSK